MRVTVIIPTTAGPAEVVRLDARRNIPLSHVNTEADYQPLSRFSERYHDFVGPAGPLRQLLDLDGPQFALTLDRAPETGRSWELPVAVAHWCRVQGHEIVRRKPDVVVWSTGAIQPDLAIGRENYHLADKLKSSREMLAGYKANGATLILLLPDGAEARLNAEQEGEAASLVHSLPETFAILSRSLGEPSRDGGHASLAGTKSTATPDHKRSRMRAILPMAAALILALLAMPIVNEYFGAPADPPVPLPQPTSDAAEIAAVAAENRESVAVGSSHEEDDSLEAALLTEEPLDPADADSGAWSEGEEVVTETATTDMAPEEIAPADTVALNTPEQEHTDAAAIPVTAIDSAESATTVAGLTLVEYRAPEGSNCIDVLFEHVAPKMMTIEPTGARFPDSESADLCALAFQRGSGEPAVEIEIDIVFYELVMKSDQARTFRLDTGQSRMFRLVHRQRQAVSYSFSIAVEPGQLRERFAHRLTSTGG